MLNHILLTKSEFIRLHGSRITSVQEFITELEVFSQNNIGLHTTVPYWSNYTHAVFISALQEMVAYDLTIWNEYMHHEQIISSFLRINTPNEGQVLELFVMHSINHVFDFGNNSLDILALKSSNSINPNYLTNDSNDPNFLTEEENMRIINNLKVVMKMRGKEEKRIWGDNDIIVSLVQNGVRQQFCIISCKTSLRERVYQSIFWAMHSRLEGIGKHVFITTDKGASGNSEIGNRSIENDAKKSRDVLESTMDRVYVLRNSIEVNRSQVIKDFTHLQTDLSNWAEDIAGQ